MNTELTPWEIKILRQKWSRQIKRRDNYTCRICKKTNKQTNLHSHHIKEYALYPDLRYNLDNGLTLCVDCHADQHPAQRGLILSTKKRRRKKRKPK